METTNHLERYIQNSEILTIEQQQRLLEARICVVGCGGLGGYVASMLARLGVGQIVLIDHDQFTTSNLNRQLFCTQQNIGQNKAEEGKKYLEFINSHVQVESISFQLTAENAAQLLHHCDLAVDCVDHIMTRFLMQEACEDQNIPLVHGAVGGWYGQVANIFPGDRLLSKIYPYASRSQTVEKVLRCPTFIPSMVASLQVCEIIKIIGNIEPYLRHAMLHIDMKSNEMHTISF